MSMFRKLSSMYVWNIDSSWLPENDRKNVDYNSGITAITRPHQINAFSEHPDADR